jgi:signal peptidase I
LRRKPFFLDLAASFYRFLSFLNRKIREKDIRTRVSEDYLFLKGRKIEFGSVIASANYLFMAGLFLLVAKKMIFFGLVTSQSMLPVLAPGDLVLCEAISLNNIQVGDIVVFEPPRGGAITIHRVVSVGPSGIKTKGDNVGVVDYWTLQKKDIQGKAVLIMGKPVVIKNIGLYLMPRRTYIPGSDPMYEFIRDLINAVHQYGPAFIISIASLAVLLSFGGQKRRYPAYT